MNTTSSAGTFTVERASERGSFDHGWLQTHHSFSFAEYFDPAKEHWGALRVFNDDTVHPGKGFGSHPHRDMEILTYVLRGELEHKDSLGNAGVVRPGGVQYVSAGTGLSHSEYNHSAENDVHFVQMWVLPRAQNLKPQYGQVDYTAAERTNTWLPIASGQDGVHSKITIWQDATAYVSRLVDSTLTYEFKENRLGFLFNAGGSVGVNGTDLSGGDALRITGPVALELRGSAELILWDVPPVSAGGRG